MGPDHVGDNGKAEAAATTRPRTVLIKSGESFKHPRAIGDRDSRAVIVHAKSNRAVCCFEFYDHGSDGVRNRVVEEVSHHTP